MAPKPWFFTPVFLAAFSACAFCAEDEPPPFDAPEPTPSPVVLPGTIEPPTDTFDATHRMKARKEKAAEARRAERLARNEAVLERVRETLKDLGAATITLYTLESDDISTGDIDPAKLDIPNGLFYGVKILQAFDVKADDAPLAQELHTRAENFGEFGALCFYPGLGVLWTSGEKRFGAVICLFCSKVVFCWKDGIEGVPLSNRGRVKGCELLRKYAPGEELEKLLKQALEREKAPPKR